MLGVWREPLLELSERLGDRGRVGPCGMARLRIVMTDGAGPLLNPRAAALMGELLCWIDDGWAGDRSASSSLQGEGP
jgi:hypothetical protein